jgi:type I restriction enzyme S subunit
MSVVESNDIWLGKMPNDWQRNRIRNVAALSPGYSSTVPAPDEPCTVVPMELLSDDGSIDVTNQQPLDEVTSGLTLFEEGDVLFAKITPCMENGKGAFVRELPRRYAFGSTEFHVLRPGKKIDGLFLYYATFNPIYRAYAAENMVGAAGQKRVSSRFVKDTRLFLPPPPEQQRIAAYLDASCAAIDAAVAAKCRQLEILDALRKTTIHHAVTKGLNAAAARRASHVGWFGEIPKHWRCEHLKRFTTRIQTGMTPPTDTPDYYLDGTIPWFAPGSYDGDIELREPRKLINELARSEGKLRMFPAGTVFLVGIGATIGKVGLVPADASCNQQIIGIVCGHRMNSRFLAYQFKIYEDVIPGIATATTLPIFDQVKTGYLPTLQPPFEEQKSICAFLDIKLAESKQIVAAIESQIATLTAYRKSLIHECVTGQQRITEADVARVRRGESESMRPNR